MLEGCKKIYEQRADLIPGWKNYSKNDLCNMYLDCEDPYKKDSYLSAIFCKYWPSLQNIYEKSKASATEQECYDWLVTSLDYTFTHSSWRDPTKKIYNDPNGPDKIINKVLRCERANFYLGSNRNKRKLNYESTYLEQLQDETSDKYMPFYTLDESDLTSPVKSIVKNFFNKKDYFVSFIVDLIVNSDCFDKENKESESSGIFSTRKLSLIFKKLSYDYFVYFSKEYNIDVIAVKDAFSYFDTLSSKKIEKKIEDTIDILKRDKSILNALKEGV